MAITQLKHSILSQQKSRVLILPGILLLGAVLRIYRLGFKPFWQDEGATWYIGNGILSSDAHPEFYFILLRNFLQLIGNDEFAGRMLSAVAGTLFIWVLFILLKALFDRNTAMIAAFLAAISPYAVAVSQEMRMYSLISLEMALMVYFFSKIWISSSEKEKVFSWMGLFCVSLAGIYTHTILGFQLLFLSFMFILVNLRKSKIRIIYWCILGFTLAIAYLPYLGKIFGPEIERTHILVHPEIHNILMNFSLIAKSIFSFFTGNLFGLLNVTLSTLKVEHKILFVTALGALFIIGLLLTIRTSIHLHRSKNRPQMSGLIFIGSLFFLNLCLFAVLEVSSPTHMVTLFVPFIILISIFLAKMTGTWQKAMISALTIISLVSLGNHYRAPYSYSERVSYAEIGQYLNQHVEPDDIVVYRTGRNAFYTLLYYSSQVPCEMRYTNVGKNVPDEYVIDQGYLIKSINSLEDPKFRRNPIKFNPAPMLASLTADYEHVWYVDNRDITMFVADSCKFSLQRSQHFGSDYWVYLLQDKTP